MHYALCKCGCLILQANTKSFGCSTAGKTLDPTNVPFRNLNIQVMLTCSGCMRHCLHSIIGDSALLTTSSRPLLTSSLNRRPLRRNHSTSYERSLAGRERYGDSTKATPAQRSPPEKEKSRGSSRGTFESRHSALEKRQDEKKPGASARLIQRKQWLDSRGIRPPSKKELKQSTSDARIQQHLKYLNDPVKLAHFVNKTLNSNGDFDFVRELVRAASKNSLHIVSWNHLVGYQMSQGKMNAAISTYNEVPCFDCGFPVRC